MNVKTTAHPSQSWYLSLLLHLLLQVVKVSGISIVVLRVESLLQPAFLLQTFVLLDLLIIHLHQALFSFIIFIILTILLVTRCTGQNIIQLRKRILLYMTTGTVAQPKSNAASTTTLTSQLHPNHMEILHIFSMVSQS